MPNATWKIILNYTRMVLPTFIFLMFGFTSHGEPQMPKFLDFSNEQLLAKRIAIRLVKKEWRPVGPSSETNDVMDEYQWDVQTAFNGLLKSSYQYESASLKNADNLYQTKEYDSSLDSIFIIHPIFATADVFFVKTTVNALAMRNLHRKYNVFAVNMPHLNVKMMLSVLRITLGITTKYEPIAHAISSFLVKGINAGHLRPENIHLIGWSYSGHLVGYIGRYISLLYEQKIASIVSLDPYTNRLNRDLVQVSREDALTVHVYHTNSIIGGTRERIGTADFVFNNGLMQPECRGSRIFKNTIPEPMICSHLKVVQRFWYVILYPSKFLARQCGSWNRFTTCLCDDNPTASMRYPIVPNVDITGTYYIRTTGSKPYGLGEPGGSCSEKTRLQKVRKQLLARSLAHVPREGHKQR